MSISTKQAYGKALLNLGSHNDKVIVLDGDLAKATCTLEFGKAYPDRFFNMGIAEQDLYSTAAGLATCGLIPFATTFAMFSAGRAYDQIRNSIAYPKLNVKIVGVHGGLSTGPDGASHQCIEDISLMRTIPNMVVVSPTDPLETAKAVDAIAKYQGPVYLRLSRDPMPIITKEDRNFTIGKADRLFEGEDLTIIANGVMLHKALKVREQLEQEGISARVINLHTIKPIDIQEVLQAASETKKLVTLEDHNIIGGLGSAVSEIVTDNYPVPVLRLGVNDVFGQSGTADELFDYYGLGLENIIKSIKFFLIKKAVAI
ncbi:MAG: transketolase family protein [Bacillota bacterium]